MSHIKISSPFLRNFKHLDFTSSSLESILLEKAIVPERRIVVIIQNQSDSVSIKVNFGENWTGNGIIIPPLGNISLDNYNGRVISWSSTEAPVHIAYATA